MFESVINFFKSMGKPQKDKEQLKSKDAAKERLQLVLMQDRANVSADFLDLMKQEIIEVIKKYIDVDENAIDVRLTNKTNEDGTTGAPALYANIPIVSIKEELKTKQKSETEEKSKEKEETEKVIETNKNNEEKKHEEVKEVINVEEQVKKAENIIQENIKKEEKIQEDITHNNIQENKMSEVQNKENKSINTVLDTKNNQEKKEDENKEKNNGQ